MKIENFKNGIEEFEHGDIIESTKSGIYYLIVKSGMDAYSFVELNSSYACPNNFKTIKEVIEYIGVSNYILHKSDSFKLVIE